MSYFVLFLFDLRSVNHYVFCDLPGFLSLENESFANSTIYSCYMFIPFISSIKHCDVVGRTPVSYSVHPDFDSQPSGWPS
jgi:hypothetical protein